jgi:hypothetical protein
MERAKISCSKAASAGVGTGASRPALIVLLAWQVKVNQKCALLIAERHVSKVCRCEFNFPRQVPRADRHNSDGMARTIVYQWEVVTDDLGQSHHGYFPCVFGWTETSLRRTIGFRYYQSYIGWYRAKVQHMLLFGKGNVRWYTAEVGCLEAACDLRDRLACKLKRFRNTCSKTDSFPRFQLGGIRGTSRCRTEAGLEIRGCLGASNGIARYRNSACTRSSRVTTNCTWEVCSRRRLR